MGLFAGTEPTTRGVRDGKLAPIRADYPNSVSSFATSAYHRIDPIVYRGDPHAAFGRITAIVRAQPGIRIVEAKPGYLYAHCESKLLKFVDDLELLLDASAGVIHVRSAARLGRKDFGVNRKRVEAIRAALLAQPPS